MIYSGGWREEKEGQEGERRSERGGKGGEKASPNSCQSKSTNICDQMGNGDYYVIFKEEVEIEDIPEGPTDPFEQAVAAKNRGNKYFRGGRYL